MAIVHIGLRIYMKKQNETKLEVKFLINDITMFALSFRFKAHQTIHLNTKCFVNQEFKSCTKFNYYCNCLL